MRTHTRTRVHTRSQADITTHPPRATATSAGTVGVRRQQGCGLAQHTGVLRATTVAVAERSLRGTWHPGHPTLPETRAAPWDSWECWPRICPLQAGPSQSPTSDHRRCPLRWRWRPLGRGDGDIPGELPRRFPHAVPECDRVLRLPTQLPLPRGHGGSARQDPSLPDPVSHASQMRGCPSGRSATLREGRPLLPDGNVAALSLVRGQGPEGIGSPLVCSLRGRGGRVFWDTVQAAGLGASWRREPVAATQAPLSLVCALDVPEPPPRLMVSLVRASAPPLNIFSPNFISVKTFPATKDASAPDGAGRCILSHDRHRSLCAML